MTPTRPCDRRGNGWPVVQSDAFECLAMRGADDDPSTPHGAPQAAGRNQNRRKGSVHTLRCRSSSRFPAYVKHWQKTFDQCYSETGAPVPLKRSQVCQLAQGVNANRQLGIINPCRRAGCHPILSEACVKLLLHGCSSHRAHCRPCPHLQQLASPHAFKSPGSNQAHRTLTGTAKPSIPLISWGLAV